MAEFTGKVAIVTGAGSGIGEACARLLASRGAQVLVADVAAGPAQRVAEAVGDAARPHVVDVTDAAACERMVRAAVDGFGRLDVAVNNAGIGGPQAPTGDYPLDGWAAVLAVNLTVWLLVGAGHGELVYFWPMWLAVPGVALLGVSVGVTALRDGRFTPPSDEPGAPPR